MLAIFHLKKKNKLDEEQTKSKAGSKDEIIKIGVGK
jgi:hypothetical protein